MSTKLPILHIPLKGGSGHAPSGPVQFQDDWPGLFIRGDHAIALAASIRHVARALAGDKSYDTADALKRLQWVADTIEQTVVTRPPGST
jgi:hypothetical protein